MLHSLAFVGAGILYIAAFGIAGLFSSRIVITDQAVLVRSDVCGAWPLSDQFADFNFQNFNDTPAVLQEREAYAINSRQDLTGSLAYVQTCYPEESSDCKSYIVGSLNQTINRNASCPFDDSLCLTEAIKIDTGYIDSAIDLGINAKPADRVWYRKIISCAVLSSDSFYSASEVGPMPDNTAYPDDDEMYFYYGPDTEGHNYTDAFSNYTLNGLYDYWYDLG